MEITCHSWRNMWKTDQGKLTIKTTLYSLCRSLLPCQRWGAVRSTSLESPIHQQEIEVSWYYNSWHWIRMTFQQWGSPIERPEIAKPPIFTRLLTAKPHILYPRRNLKPWKRTFLPTKPQTAMEFSPKPPNRQPMGDPNNDGWQEVLLWSCARRVSPQGER